MLKGAALGDGRRWGEVMTGLRTTLLICGGCPLLLWGQESITPAYTPPTAHEFLQEYMHAAFGPGALFRAVSGAAFYDVRSESPQFGRGPEGLLKMAGVRVSANVARQSLKYGVSAWLREDPRYYPCECSGFLPRLRYALLSAVTARRPDGRRVVGWGALAGAYGSGMLEAEMLRDGRSVPGEGARFGSGQIGAGFACDIAREFWPDVRRHFHKHKRP